MKVLVTGGAGFIGSHSVDALLDQGAEVLVVDDLSASDGSNLSRAARRDGFRFEHIGVLHEDKLAHSFATFRPDAVLHLAGLVNVQRSLAEPAENFRINLQGTDVVARTALRHGCPRFVFASSASFYADATELPLTEDRAGERQTLSPYAATKLAAEILLGAYARSCGLAPVLLRYFNVYGPQQNPASPYSGVISTFLDRGRQGLPLHLHGDGDQTRDFVHVRDVARINAVAVAGTLAAGTYNVCTGRTTSLKDLVAAMREWFPFLTTEHGPCRHGDIRHSLGSPARLRSKLDRWSPLELRDGLRELIVPALRSHAVDPTIAVTTPLFFGGIKPAQT